MLRDAVDEITTHHSGYYIDDTIAPAPLVIYDAWTDDIMPVDEALRFYRKTKSLYPAAEISLQFADHFSHMRGNLGNPLRPYTAVTQLFARHLKSTGGPLPGILETYTQACPPALEEGPFSAADWDALHPGEVRHVDASMKTFDSAGGDPLNATLTDPVAGGATACRTAPSSADDPGAATYRLPVTCAGYTLMGSPTVIADVVVSGDFPQIASRLWDVAPDTTQTLVAHALYRPRLDNLGPQVFQLHPGGWRFAAGHVVKLELLGQSSPYGLPSNGTFAVTVSNLELRLPTRETPDGCVVQSPAPHVLPPSDPEAMDTTTILGKRLQVRNPGSAVQRRIMGQARERFSPNTIVGDPVANGASLRIIANGGTDSDQTFNLPPAGWRRTGSVGFRYSNRLPGGAVKKASIRRTPNGTFQINVLIPGKYGAVDVVPPNPGDNGGFILALTGGSTYCVGFGGAAGGIETMDTSAQWSVRTPIAEVCPAP